MRARARERTSGHHDREDACQSAPPPNGLPPGAPGKPASNSSWGRAHEFGRPDSQLSNLPQPSLFK